jgi:hypothetical protein
LCAALTSITCKIKRFLRTHVVLHLGNEYILKYDGTDVGIKIELEITAVKLSPRASMTCTARAFQCKPKRKTEIKLYAL